MLSWESLYSIAVGGSSRLMCRSWQKRSTGEDTRFTSSPGWRRVLGGMTASTKSTTIAAPLSRAPTSSRTSIAWATVSLIAWPKPRHSTAGRSMSCTATTGCGPARLARVKNDLHRPVVLTMHSTEFGRCGNVPNNGPSSRVREIEWGGTFVADRVICVSRSPERNCTACTMSHARS